MTSTSSNTNIPNNLKMANNTKVSKNPEPERVNYLVPAASELKIPSDDVTVEQTDKFENMQMNDMSLRAALSHYTHPTTTQTMLDTIFKHPFNNFYINSDTGTGKTVMYLLACINQIDSSIKGTQALIMVPTKELGMQIYNEAVRISINSGLTIAYHRGQGIDRNEKQKNFRVNTEDIYSTNSKNRDGTEQLVIGTPGKLLQLFHAPGFIGFVGGRGRTVRLFGDHVKIIVMDECDKIFAANSREMGDQCEEIIRRIDSQKLFVSATVTDAMLNFCEIYEPVILAVDTNNSNRSLHYYIKLNETEKISALEAFVDMFEGGSVFVFVNSTKKAQRIYEDLDDHAYSVGLVHSKLSNSERTAALKNFKECNTKILVCTDVCARGIDIVTADLVFVYDWDPEGSHQDYKHRSGRAGRGDKTGRCISFLNDDNSNSTPYDITRMQNALNITFTAVSFPQK